MNGHWEDKQANEDSPWWGGILENNTALVDSTHRIGQESSLWTSIPPSCLLLWWTISLLWRTILIIGPNGTASQQSGVPSDLSLSNQCFDLRFSILNQRRKALTCSWRLVRLYHKTTMDISMSPTPQRNLREWRWHQERKRGKNPGALRPWFLSLKPPDAPWWSSG